METECLAKTEMTLPQDGQEIKLIDLPEQIRYGKQSSINSIIIIRWLCIFACMACWYGVYKLVQLFIS